MNTNWTIGEVLDRTFRAFGKNWVTLVVGYLVMTLITMAPVVLWAAVAFVPPLLRGESAGPPQFDGTMIGSAVLAFIGTFLLAILFAPAQARLALAATRDQRPRIAEAFDFRRAGALFSVSLLGGLAVIGGSLLLLVPGIIIALGLAFVSFFVIDTTLGPIDAMRASWAATRGHRAHLFGFIMLAVLAQLLAQLILGVTVILAPLQMVLSLVQTPLWMLALATIYDRIRPAPSPTDPLALPAA
jgi:hypothetical protein